MFRIAMDVDVRALFNPASGEFPAWRESSAAVLAQEGVQQEFVRLTTLSGRERGEARWHFIMALQAYNTAVGAHQSAAISELNSPFVTTPELVRRLSFIQAAMQRDVIANTRDQAGESAKQAKDLWGMPESHRRELREHFEETATRLTAALESFDRGEREESFARYVSTLEDNTGYQKWMGHAYRRSERLKLAREIGITAAAAMAAQMATGGLATVMLGIRGVAALSSGAQMGMLVANGAAFTVAHRVLTQQFLDIPFWRKAGAAANTIDLITETGRMAALMGTLRVANEMAAIAMPVAEGLAAPAVVRGFAAELAGFNSFDVLTSSDPRAVFSAEHQLNQVAFLLGLRMANGVTAAATAGFSALHGPPIVREIYRQWHFQFNRQAVYRAVGDTLSGRYARQLRGRATLKRLADHMDSDTAFKYCHTLLGFLMTDPMPPPAAWTWAFRQFAGRLDKRDFKQLFAAVAVIERKSLDKHDYARVMRWSVVVASALFEPGKDGNREKMLANIEEIPPGFMTEGQIRLYAHHIRFLPPKQRLGRVFHLVERLDARESQVIDGLSSVVDSLNCTESLKLAERLMSQLGFVGMESVARLVAFIVPNLRPGKRLAVALQVVREIPWLPSKENFAAFDAMTDALPNEAVVPFTLALTKWIGKDPEGSIRWLGRLYPRLPPRGPSPGKPSPRFLVVMAILKSLNQKVLLTKTWESSGAWDNYLRMIRQLPEKDTILFFDELINMHFFDNIRSHVLPLIEEVILRLRRHGRLVALERLVARFDWADIPADMLRPLIRPIPPDLIVAYATSHENEGMLNLGRYLASGLMVDPYLLRAYRNAPDKEVYLNNVGEKARVLMRGAPLRNFDDEETRLAYAGLDVPRELSYDDFRSRIMRQPPQQPFIRRSFRLRVPELGGGHDTIDKGVLLEVLNVIQDIQEPRKFFSRLESGKGIPEPLRRLIISYTGGKSADAEDPAGLARSLLKKGFKDTDWLVLPEVQDLLLHALVFLAWHNQSSEVLHPAIRAVHDGLTSRLVATPTLIAGLKATEELFRDRLVDAAITVGVDLSRLISVTRLQKLLASQRARGSAQIRRLVDVDFIPSKSQADLFFPNIGEDCTDGMAIYSPDFQLYRMIADNHLLGAVYLEQKMTESGKKVLFFAVQPRSRWRVDARALLAGIERSLGIVAEEEGYHGVYLMDNVRKQSNREDMLAAIRGRGYRSAPLPLLVKDSNTSIFFRQPRDYMGNVLVVWERGMTVSMEGPIGKAKGTEESLSLAEAQLPPLARRPIVVMEDQLNQEALWRLFKELRDHLPALFRNGVPPSPALKSEMMRAMQEVGFATSDEVFGLSKGDAENPQAPTELARRHDPLVIRGALVLRRKSPILVFNNSKITRTDRGWIEPTLVGKERVVLTEEGKGNVLATGREVTPQDLFDFYTIVMHQGRHFHAFLILLKNRGADVRPLVTVVDELDATLDQGIEALLDQQFDEALRAFQICDEIVPRFRVVMREIANAVGLDVDPVTGAISELAVP